MLRAATWCALAVMGAQTRLSTLADRARSDETGSNTLETVVIAAGLLALAVGLVVVIKTAVTHYSASIQ